MTTSEQSMPSAAERIAALVARIPAGNVTTYGEVAKAVGTGARFVGTTMRNSRGLPWWRVVRADGTSHDIAAARPMWDSENIPYRGARADLSACGLDREDLNHLCAE